MPGRLIDGFCEETERGGDLKILSGKQKCYKCAKRLFSLTPNSFFPALSSYLPKGPPFPGEIPHCSCSCHCQLHKPSNALLMQLSNYFRGISELCFEFTPLVSTYRHRRTLSHIRDHRPAELSKNIAVKIEKSTQACLIPYFFSV